METPRPFVVPRLVYRRDCGCRKTLAGGQRQTLRETGTLGRIFRSTVRIARYRPIANRVNLIREAQRLCGVGDESAKVLLLGKRGMVATVVWRAKFLKTSAGLLAWAHVTTMGRVDDKLIHVAPL
jgi:hypothetical protein